MGETRLRLRFAKREAVRYLSHLDLVRVFERALRRSRAPVLYSQGFNPRPRMSIPFALALGTEARREILELRLEENSDVEGFVDRLRVSLPEGLEIESFERVADFRKPSCVRARYRVSGLSDPPPSDALLAERIAGSASLAAVRSAKRDADGVVLDVELRDGRGPRPIEILRALEIDPGRARAIREDLSWDAAEGATSPP